MGTTQILIYNLLNNLNIPTKAIVILEGISFLIYYLMYFIAKKDSINIERI